MNDLGLIFSMLGEAATTEIRLIRIYRTLSEIDSFGKLSPQLNFPGGEERE
jgi:hypothetical protein